MTYATETYSDVAPFRWPALPMGNFRPLAVGVAVVSFGTVAAASAISALAAAWIIVASLTANLNVYERAPVANKMVALATPYGTLAGAADFSSSAPGSDVYGYLPDLTYPVAPRQPAAATLDVAAAPAPSPIVASLPPKRAPQLLERAPLPAAAAPPSIAPLPPLRTQETAEATPLPPPRPFFLAPVQAKRDIIRSVARIAAPRIAAPREAVVSPPRREARNPFEMLFDALSRPPGRALADARSEDGVIPLASPAGGRTAIYDIAAHTVYLPDGERLEAHSGLGAWLDDPRSIDLKDRGVTPPHAYDLVLRRRLFHGVRALRLNPVGGGNMYGRSGILAHTYMLGPNGQSNGCVSFKNYPKFLNAFLRGQVDRLVVVAHMANPRSRFAHSYRYASN